MKKLAFIWCLILLSCDGHKLEKINGVSFVASREEIAQSHVNPVLDIHANYAAIMPFGFMQDPNLPSLIFDTDRQWFGETRDGAKQYIEMLHKNGVKVMLKPQIWIRRGEFTGNMPMPNSFCSMQDWQRKPRATSFASGPSSPLS